MSNILPSAASVPTAGSTASANTYTDVSGLAALKTDPNSPQSMHAVAQQVDAMFLQMMLKSMRDASADVGEPESNEMGMYQDMFDKQIALNLSQHQSLGLGALLTRQQTAAAPPAPGMAVIGSTGSAAAASASASNLVNTRAAGGETDAGTTPESASEFVNQVLPTIRQAADALGVSPLGLLAQAVLETGWGKRMARTVNGNPSLNLFGIKADEHWGGERATAKTLEFVGGVATQGSTAFRAYGSITDSVNDFAHLLQNSPRYRQAIAAGTSAQAYVASIGKSGYATDPDYASKLNGILNSSTFRTALGARYL
jgi:flagellar protein FlgJ